MSNINLKQILYDELDELFLGDVKKKGTTYEITSSVLQLLPMGQPITKKDYANAVSLVSYNEGNMGASENLATLVNIAPKASIELTSNGNLESFYSQLIKGATPSKVTKLTPDQEEAYQLAQSILYVEEEKVVKGKKVIIREDSQEYQDYENLKDEYVNALYEMEDAKSKYDLSEPREQRYWLMESKKYQREIDKVKKKLIKYKDVEDALSFVGALCKDAISQILSKEKDNFENSKIDSLGSGPSWHMCYAYPSDWYENNDIYSHLIVDESKSRSHENSKYFNLSAETDASFGIVSATATADHSHVEKHKESKASITSIELDVAVVDIKRPWLNETLFTLPNWQMNGVQKSYFSDGTFITKDEKGQLKCNSGCMPLIPKSFVIVKNVIIHGNFSQENLDFIKNQTEIGTNVSIGPFHIKSQTSFGDEHNDENYEVSSKTMTIPHPQIIGFISSVVPLCPQNEEH